MRSDIPFRIGVIGDFSGREREAGSKPLKPVPIDRDDFDGVLARLNPKLELAIGGSTVALAFSELDDFEPDRIFERAELFAKLRELRRRLQDPATFAETAAELQGWGEEANGEEPQPTAAPPSPPPAAEGDLLSAAISATEGSLVENLAGGSKLADDLVREIVAPYVLPKPDPRRAELVDSVDHASSALMRAILHHPSFQTMEAAWRGLYLLVRRLETGTDLTLSILDRTKEELADDLLDGGELDASELYRVLVEDTVGTPGGVPWSLLVGADSFGPTAKDADLLAALARVSEKAGAAFVAAAEPGLVGCASLAETPDPADWKVPMEEVALASWQSLRSLRAAAHVALALPRFLLRLPYGSETNPIEAFAFEELPGLPRHEHYLWGSPGFAIACALGQAFAQSGWTLRPSEIDPLAALPVHVFEKDGEQCVQLPAEIQLHERSGERIARHGIVTLWSVQGSDELRLGSLRSLADPPRELQGRWSRSDASG